MAYGSCRALGTGLGSQGDRIRGGSACSNNLRRAAKTDPIVVKTHFPFHGRQWYYMRSNQVSAIITTRRNPVDSYDSYRRFRHDHWTEDYPGGVPTFKLYIAKWAKFHEYWDDYSDRTCTPVVSISFEDMVSHPQEALEAVLKQTGLWTALKLGQDDVERAVRTVAEQDESARKRSGENVTGSLEQGQGLLKSYGNPQKFGEDITLEDMQWTLRRCGKLLASQGYIEYFKAAVEKLQSQSHPGK